MHFFFRLLISIMFACCAFQTVTAKNYTISGRILTKGSKAPIEFATVYLPQNELWAISDESGRFTIKNVPEGKNIIHVQCLGYSPLKLDIKINKDINALNVEMKENNLALEEVVVTAQKSKDEQTSSYYIDRTTLEHAQVTNLNNITSLLPGGKSIHDSSLANNDSRIALHGYNNEMGNASFGTAINVDGVRLDNNSTMSETQGIGLRNLSSSNIESVEIITGIPSVEYGDLSNGMVKIHTRKGKTPWVAVFSTEPKTKQIALNKGFRLWGKGGTLNTCFERTKSTSDIASPHTSYERNVLSLNYSNIFKNNPDRPLNLSAGFTGNIGGYNSKDDPDAFSHNYTKQRDYTFRGHINADWLLNLPWITNVSFSTSISYSDRLNKINTNRNSSSSQPLIHSMEEGYFIATEYDEKPNANIILGPTGYWYELKYNDQRPLTNNKNN